MTRGYSLEKDLKLLLNNPKYSDIEILCEDGKILYGCRAILAVRSEVFDGLLYNGMKESYEKQISFPTINSTTMEIILEYAYTGLIKDESLTEDNIIEAFNAADFFQLISLQDVIMKRFHTFLGKKEYIPELLSKAVETMPLSEDNILLNLLVEALATIPLNTIKFDRISITALEYFLCYTHEIKKPFVTPEYEVFRYSAILAAKQVSDDSYKTIMKRLPTLEQIESSIKVENEIITKQQEIIEALKPLLRFIDFKRIKEQIITDIIEPLGITSNVKIDKYKLTSNLYSTRGTTSYMPLYFFFDF
ncbi:BTB/POZ protein [Glomus cerebriforme]|uniref:BTB/POZ protein n=1 Tax=Glomus cerebriforme TaxID=658196 RepID=A0A397S7Y9_9GLOM|nr:BTB/POZ protein [Glomus cerebriforme]